MGVLGQISDLIVVARSRANRLSLMAMPPDAAAAIICFPLSWLQFNPKIAYINTHSASAHRIRHMFAIQTSIDTLNGSCSFHGQ